MPGVNRMVGRMASRAPCALLARPAPRCAHLPASRTSGRRARSSPGRVASARRGLIDAGQGMQRCWRWARAMRPERISSRRRSTCRLGFQGRGLGLGLGQVAGDAVGVGGGRHAPSGGALGRHVVERALDAGGLALVGELDLQAPRQGYRRRPARPDWPGRPRSRTGRPRRRRPRPWRPRKSGRTGQPSSRSDWRPNSPSFRSWRSFRDVGHRARRAARSWSCGSTLSRRPAAGTGSAR